MKAYSNGLKTKINVSIQSLTKETESDCTGGRKGDAVRYYQSEQLLFRVINYNRRRNI